MESIEISLPKLGESILSATVVHWFKQEGDTVRLDEPLLEVATDKVNSEIPSPCAGVITKIHAQNGQELKVGELLATLQPVNAALEVPTVRGESSCSSEEKLPPVPESPVVCANSSGESARSCLFAGDAMGETYLSPAVLRLAKEYSLPLQALLEIPGGGEGGRLTKQDVEDFIRKKQQEKARPVAPSVTPPLAGQEEVCLPLSPLRKIVAENVEKSYKEIPHAYLVQEIDVTAIQEKIRQIKDIRNSKKLPKITLTSIVVFVLGKIVHRFPLLNSSFSWDGIKVKKAMHCGVAVNVDQGVVVPVVKNVESLSLDQIAAEIQVCAEAARAGKMHPGQTQGGTFTLTNFGMSGIALGFPIIKAQEAAILAIGSLQNKVVARSSREFGIREVVQVTLAFDHRIFDGIYACQFLKELQTYLEDPFHDSRISL